MYVTLELSSTFYQSYTQTPPKKPGPIYNSDTSINFTISLFDINLQLITHHNYKNDSKKKKKNEIV